MKKFVGNVNGKSFDNEEDFNKAADEAIKKNDGNLSISSYYSYTSDDEKSSDDVKDDDKFVSTYEYFLGDKKPDNVSADSVEYNVPDSLATRIKEASNKEGIRKNVEYHVNNLVDGIHSHQKEIKNLQDEIEALQSKLYEKIDNQKDLKGRRRYYNTILDILDEPEDEKKIEEHKKEEVAKPESENIRTILGFDGNSSLFDILKQLGLLK